MVFQFELMDLDSPLGGEHEVLIHRNWKLSELREIVRRWQNFKRDEGFWNAYDIPSFVNTSQVSEASRF